jgi:hypothetical protein
MKRFLFAMALATATVSAFAADVGVSVSVGQPGFYGRIDIGNAPQPRLIFAEPIVIQRPHVVRQPIYLHVPPGHEKNWRKHCRKYNACGQPVYFVENNWYNEVYVPHYHKHSVHGNKGDDKRRDDERHGKSKGKRND